MHLGRPLPTMAAVAAVLAELRTAPESAVWASLVPFPVRPPITPAVVQRARITQCLWQVDLGEEVRAARDRKAASVD